MSDNNPRNSKTSQWIVIAIVTALLVLLTILLFTWTLLVFKNSGSSESTTSSSLLPLSSTAVPPPFIKSTLPSLPSSSHPDNQTRLLAYVTPYKLPPTVSPSSAETEQEQTELVHPMQNNSIPNWFEPNYPSRFSSNTPSPLPPLPNSPPPPQHDSGQYRQFYVSIWDPHPQYKFNAFGETWHLSLSSSGSIGSTIQPIVVHHEGNVTRRDPLGVDTKCFYNGIVVGDETSIVTVSLCQGMTGHIRTRSGSYFIEPVSLNGMNGHGSILHKFYRLGSTFFHNNSSTSSSSSNTASTTLFHDDDFIHDGQLTRQKTMMSSREEHGLDWEERVSEEPGLHHSRAKRSMSRERYIELMVVTDSTMSAYHGENLKHYVLTLLSIVALIYSDASIGNPMNVALVKFHILKDVDFIWKQSSRNQHSNNYHYNSVESSGNEHSSTSTQTHAGHGISASEMLRNFCKWQKEHNHVDDHSPLHHDTALLLTRETICRNPWLQKCDTLGLAELGTMCDNYASCAIVQDNGLSAAFTIAHELGHVMNMPHDDDTKCASFGGGRNTFSIASGSITAHYVMSRMLDHNTYPWAWSRCSRHYLTEFLDAGHGYCLEDRPPSNLLQPTQANSRQPGEIFSEDKQCELVFGPNSHLCSYMPVCRRLWCTSGDEEDGCRTQHMPWADGTPCAPNGHKWCQRGACVLKDLEKLKMVDGNWGQWKPYGACSRTCSGGVRRSTRECDSPLPSNGGKYCLGPRIRYESCNTAECAGEHKDFRAEQCSQFNNDNFNIQGLPKNVTWVPKYTGIITNDRCKLFCRVGGSSAYYLLREKVVDGTPCTPDTFDICVNGACLPAGCDRRLHSKRVLDSCGICNGDGSTCKTQAGSYNETKYGYNTVVRIPAGASNLDVRQRGANDSARDDNYLAIIDPSTNDYLLNGHFVVSMFRKTIHAVGTTLEYSGSDSAVERINATLPLRHDLIIQVLSVGKLFQPDIRYQYVISSNPTTAQPQSSQISYQWILSDEYSDCSALCMGKRSRQYNCIRRSQLQSQQSVEYSYCPGEQPSSQREMDCNVDCVLKWSCASDCAVENMVCIKVSGNRTMVVGDEHCSELRKECDDCELPSIWSECSRICGEGVQTCKNCVGNSAGGIRRCNNGPCGQWRINEWSPCSTTCGTHGIHRALYSCHHLDGSLLSPDYCQSSTKPVVERKCENPPCSLQWLVEEWSSCSATCGVGRMQRKVQCVVDSGNVNDKYCHQLLKPLEEADCRNHNECPAAVINNSANDALRNHEIDNYIIPFDGISSVIDWIVEAWSECESETNFKVYHRRKVRCTNSEDECERDKRPVSIEECNNTWWTGDWGRCNTTCGEGTETRPVRCPQRQSCPVSSKPSLYRSCTNNSKCKYRRGFYDGWNIGPWGKCSKLCGGGIKLRQAVCTTGNCQDKPMDMMSCNLDPCPIWHTNSWSECTVECGGGGIQERTVQCRDTNGIIQSGDHCSHISIRPNGTRECGTKECVPSDGRNNSNLYSRWTVGNWTNCTKKCGKGVKRRLVQCTQITNMTIRTIVDDTECKKTKPRVQRGCARFPCPFKWITSEWSECTTTCGYGLQQRTVSCARVNKYGWIDPDPVPNGCETLDKPKEYTYCMYAADCNSPYRWIISDWSECPSPTSTGYKCKRQYKQKRKVYCALKATGQRVGGNFCLKNHKPIRKRACPTKSCQPASCADKPADGEYVLWIGGTNISIYCSSSSNGRNSSSSSNSNNSSGPRRLEYLTLPEDNYSEVYAKRLIRPETCPRGGVRLDSCECVEDENRRVGYTVYEKVRIDVARLVVDVDDLTFTRQITGASIPYANSGDCYSSMNCPQGRFSINLQGTGLQVSPITTWVSQGHKAAMWINKSEDNVRVTGKCGGYCGNCAPNRLIGLKLQPA